MENNHKSHRQQSDAEFLDQLSHCQMDPSIFTHEAHLRLVWLLSSKLSLDDAIKQVKKTIFQFVQHVGATEKYNETLTIAAVNIVHRLAKATTYKDFNDFLKSNPALTDDFQCLIMRHYSSDIFNSEEAKKRFVKPELVPFDK